MHASGPEGFPIGAEGGGCGWQWSHRHAGNGLCITWIPSISTSVQPALLSVRVVGPRLALALSTHAKRKEGRKEEMGKSKRKEEGGKRKEERGRVSLKEKRASQTDTILLKLNNR